MRAFTILLATALAGASLLGSAPVAARNADTDTAQADATHLLERTQYRRAVEAAIWGMPIVAADAIRQGYLKLGAKYNDIAYYSKVPDWKFQTTTPNASTHYLYSAYTTRDGPIVVDVPVVTGAGLYGQLCDMWDVPLAITGPGGEDKGQGGRYLILPPDFSGEVPTGYFPVRQKTYGGFWLMRTIPAGNTQADLDAAIALLKKVRVYPLSQAANPPVQNYIDASGRLWDGVPRMDESFYAVLARMVSEEPVNERDLAMMNMLRSIGIRRGQPFTPDAARNTMLRRAVAEGKANMVNQLRSALKPFTDAGGWALPDASGMETQFSYQTSDMLDYDGRGMLGFYGWAPPMKQDDSAPSIYLQTLTDSKGQPLSGDHAYRLRVPANVPARQYWSLTLYDADTAAFIREAPVISLDSFNQKARKNADGSLDIYLAAQAPAEQENNWIATAKGGQFIPMFRLYGPEKAFFDKTWKLPDIERIR